MQHSAVVYIDIGNTNLKWWLVEQGAVARSGAVPSKAEYVDGLLGDLVRSAKGLSAIIGCVYIASVKSSSFTCYAANRLSCVLGVSVYAVNVVPILAGLSIAYAEPKRLGVDRWLGMHAAYLSANKGYAVYISAGSAITVDVVDVHGQHLGGYIAPGVGMQRSMLNFTDKSVTKVSRLAGDVVFGGSTQSCVDGGISAMLSGFIDQLLVSVLRLPDAAKLGVFVFISGGDAEVIHKLFGCNERAALGLCEVRVCPSAVLEGLKYICSYDEALSLLMEPC